MKIAKIRRFVIGYVDQWSYDQDVIEKIAEEQIDLSKEQPEWMFYEKYVKANDYRELLVRYEKLKRENSRLKKHKTKLIRFINFLRQELRNILMWTYEERAPLRERELHRIDDIVRGDWKKYEVKK